MNTTQQERDEVLDMDYEQSYALMLRRGAHAAALEAAASALVVSSPGQESRRIRRVREEWLVQSAAIKGIQLKGDLAVQGLGDLARRSHDSYIDTVDHMLANKHRADHGEHQANVNAVTTYFVEDHGVHVVKIQEVVARAVGRETLRDLYIEPLPLTLRERLGL